LHSILNCNNINLDPNLYSLRMPSKLILLYLLSMQIIIPRNTFLEELFPGINDHKNLTEEDLVIIKEAYTNGGREPRITVEEDHISIILEEESQETSQDFDQLIALAEAAKFDKALRLANRLISEYPAAADLHRIKGQILSEQ